MSIALIVQHQDADAGRQTETPERVFSGPLISIGSDDSATLHLADRSIAPEQAVIISVEDGPPCLISRATGTTLNDERLPREARRALKSGDRLRVGSYNIIFRPHETPAEERVSEAPGIMTAEEKAPPAEDASPLSFAQLMDELRTAEDCFSFQIEGGEQEGGRLIVEGTNVEQLLGYAEAGGLTLDTARIVTPCALLRKDWSGVLLEPAGAAGRVTVNGERLQEARRLRGGDRILLGHDAGRASESGRPQLIFREPAALTLLDSMLERWQWPLPVTPSASEPAAPTRPSGPVRALSAGSSSREYFGAFTLFELGLMAAGTFAGAVIIFLLLSAS